MAENLNDLLANAKVFQYDTPVYGFVKDLYELAIVKNTDSKEFGLELAALFDLAVSSLYLEKIVSTGWYICNNDGDLAKYVYPFVNACPLCTLNSDFHFIPAKKPESGTIGQATSAILGCFLDLHLTFNDKHHGRVSLAGGNGLVDAFIVDDKKIVLLEIKSAPLIAFPLEMTGSALTDLNVDGSRIMLARHSQITPSEGTGINFIISSKLRIPVGDLLGFKRGKHYPVIVEWLKNNQNYQNFTKSWKSTFRGYANPAMRDNTYWLTNGCGSPSPRPLNWPVRRTGSGVESISDGKSSVGLDRTDDVKKGIYQVLKMSVEFKNNKDLSDYSIMVALASNIHAVKHHDEYLKPVQDLLWTEDSVNSTSILSRNDSITEINSSGLHNLVDGLINFTAPYYREEFLAERFAF